MTDLENKTDVVPSETNEVVDNSTIETVVPEVETTFDSTKFFKEKDAETMPTINSNGDVVLDDKVEDNNTNTNNPILGFDSSLKHAWEYLYEDLSNEETKYELPEILKTGKKEDGTILTPREEYDMMREHILKNTDFGLDDFAVEYLRNKKDPEFNQKEFLESKLKVHSMTDEDRIFNDMRSRFNETDVTDEDITNEIKSMSESSKKIRAAELKSKETEINERLRVQQLSKQVSQLEEQTKQENEALLPIINPLIEAVKLKKSIAGFELGEAETAEFANKLPDLVAQKLFKDEQGNIYKRSQLDIELNEVLQNPEASLELAYFLLARKDGSINKYTQSLKNQVKDNIENKLNPTPNIGGSAGANQSNAFDPNKFTRS